MTMFGYDYLAYGFEWAEWAYDNEDRTKTRKIKVEIVSEKDRQWSATIRNLVTSADSTVLLTRYNYAYKIGQHVKYRGKWYLISAIGEKSLEINPQAMLEINPIYNMVKILELNEVEW